MTYERNEYFEKSLAERILIGAAVIAALCVVPVSSGQERDRDKDKDRITKIDPGTLIAVRTNETIDTDKKDDLMYTGFVDQDVRGENGRLTIPGGALVELAVSAARDNDLVIDLESVRVDGQRYAVSADANRDEARRDDNLVGTIVGADTGEQVRGRAVRIRRNTILAFRTERPLELVVPDLDHSDHKTK